MECTMPSAQFTPLDHAKTLEYVFNCLEEAFRGLSFVSKDCALDVRSLKKKITDVSAAVGDELRYV